jgi:signal transduction histidine kinase
MESMDMLLFGLAVLCAGLTLTFAVLLAQARAALTGARAERDRAGMAETAALRVLRLAVHDLRAAAMPLFGLVERAATAGSPSLDPQPVLAGVRLILTLIDDMQDHAVPGAASRVLDLEPLALEPVLSDAIAAVSAALEPGRRSWRVAGDIGGCTVLADRRALSQVLTRVLGNAARQSRHGDWIDVSVQRREAGLALVVADEGAGLGGPVGAAPPGHPESRGLGLGLVLARVLMEALGGALAIDSAARIGTRVTMSFPPDRVLRMARSPAAAAGP